MALLRRGGPEVCLALSTTARIPFAIVSVSERGLLACAVTLAAGSGPLRLAREPGATITGPLCAADMSFTVHAATIAKRDDPAGRQALCRYVLRPPLAQDRVTVYSGSQLNGARYPVSAGRPCRRDRCGLQEGGRNRVEVSVQRSPESSTSPRKSQRQCR